MSEENRILWICLEIAIVAFIISFAMNYAEKDGYIQALSDIKDGKPQRYVLEKQKNGKPIWVKNKEAEK